MDAATFQILGNLKILATGLAGRWLMGRQMSVGKWCALVLLSLGAGSTQLGRASDAGGGAAFGYASALACVTLSATVGVFTEKFRAREKDQALSQTNKRPRLFLSSPEQQDLSTDTTVNPARSAVMESPGSPREGPHGVSDQLSAARETVRAERQSVDASWSRAAHQVDGDGR